MGECGFIQGKMTANILGKKQVLLCVLELTPGLELAKVIPVLTLKLSATYPIKGGNSLAALRLRID